MCTAALVGWGDTFSGCGQRMLRLFLLLSICFSVVRPSASLHLGHIPCHHSILEAFLALPCPSSNGSPYLSFCILLTLTHIHTRTPHPTSHTPRHLSLFLVSPTLNVEQRTRVQFKAVQQNVGQQSVLSYRLETAVRFLACPPIEASQPSNRWDNSSLPASPSQ